MNIVAIMLGLALVGTSQETTRTIPSAFQGEWNRRIQDCGTGNNDSRLRIRADEVRFYGTSGRVRTATLRGREISLTLDMRGEGETWTDRYQFILSPDGSRLSSRSQDGSLYTRYRCPN